MCYRAIRTKVYGLMKHFKTCQNKQPQDLNARLKVVISSDIRAKIESEALQAYQNGIETCGFLLGNIKNEIMWLVDATGPGTNPRLTAAMCEPDYSVLAPHLARGETVVGEWHLHLGYGARLSSGDKNTLLNASGVIPGFIAIVVNMNSQTISGMAAFSVSNGEIVNVGLESKERLARIVGLVDPQVLSRKKVGVFGGGSGGSKCTEMLARTGVEDFVLVDLPNERLEKVNLPRHIGFERDLGKSKTAVIAEILKLIDKKVKVRTEHFDISKDEERLAEVVAWCDLVMACPGDPSANALINKVCLELKKPAVFAGAFEKGKGGYVFALDPSDEDAACFSCLFGLAGIPDSNVVVRQAARNYGIDESQLHAQQGLCLDVTQIAILQTRLALCMLLKDTEHEVADINGNLIWVDNRKLQIRVLPVRKRQDCYACNKETWLASHSQNGQVNIEPARKNSMRQAAKRQSGFLSVLSKAFEIMTKAKKPHRERDIGG
jgi:molybdopterin/thiamine biosynthesis adenylyltransferase/proteasome lid subunit RPN8/RPN11